ncbi:MAG: flagellar hook basal-body protein [Planctomycetes bacterium]|nr:flagellar hook basal-body protein [Planctomycetota bacterium]
MASYAEIGLARSLTYLADSQAAISNNIANATTHSYKRKTPVAQMRQNEFDTMLGSSLPTITYSEATDFSAGSQRAGGKMNLALGDGQFLRVQNGHGTFYTRRGELIVNSEGELSTPGGDRYLGIAGLPVKVGGASELRIERNGAVFGTVDKEDVQLGQLGVFQRPANSDFRPIGRSLYHDRANRDLVPELAPDVRQGYVEESNVDVLRELVQMIGVQRSFGAATRAMSILDQIQESYVSSMNR